MVSHKTFHSTSGIDYLIREDVWRVRYSGFERAVGHFSQAGQGVRSTSTTGAGDNSVVCLLSDTVIPDRYRRSGLHERTAEESISIPTVGQHMERNRDCPGALAPAAARGGQRPIVG